MLSQRIGLAALAFATVLGGGALMAGDASAKGHCAAGQILKVSSGTCISRAAATQQGIIGGKRKAAREVANQNQKASQATADVANADADKAAEDENVSSVARTAPQAPAQSATGARNRDAALAPAGSQVMASAASPAVRIEVVKTEPRPTPAILMPTWPYGELAAFPRRVSP